jgi:hypothetical protein
VNTTIETSFVEALFLPVAQRALKLLKGGLHDFHSAHQRAEALFDNF